ncbi:DUF3072 domain-containing protein [Aestuariimicrobium sp. p3-SID1156]|uniref:DUF3072 domain-containing protein n=1 Tax=Aestuariimicrobium sp. p3-SID1156 TaxID=2916038 RepID=UPI00223A8EB5|nr:DUF3072 domain-containing protein [Aestuariimicrobium sp. p3-SID1156]MCT1458171.1 DUF3072 domain-containing protein [Aestuariimicrobium sp. p3-SID1156]
MTNQNRDELNAELFSDTTQQGNAAAPVQPDEVPADDPRHEARQQHAGQTLGSSEAAPQGLQKDPSNWVTGDDPMTESQRSYLDSLARQAGEELPANLTKAEASEQIDRLQAQTGQQPRTS